MKIRGLKTVAKSSRWLRSKFVRKKALILGYHRIVESTWDPYLLNVSPRHFAEQLDVLRKVARPVRLEHLASCVRNGDVPARSVAITLDDGYVDNLHNATPLLLARQVPATVFVATGYIGGQFWWDEMGELLKPGINLPDRIHLTVNGRCFERRLGDYNDVQGRRRVVSELYNLFRPLQFEMQLEGVARLRTVLSVTSQGESSIRAMTGGELRQMATSALVDIGAHTVTHPFLAEVELEEQRREIKDSKLELEMLLERPVTAFSFPNGSQSKETMKSVREAGFVCACGIFNDVVWSGSDLFCLPRLWPPNCDGDRFARWLRHWLEI